MSEENVEIVRRIYEATGRRDTETVLSLYDEDVEWDVSDSPISGVTGGGLFRGHDGLREWARVWYAAWESVVDECEELIDAGEYVVSVVMVQSRGRASGLDVSLRSAAVWTVRNGKVVRVAWFATRNEALAAAGVEAVSPNVELVRSMFAAWSRGDFSATDWADPELEMDVVDGLEGAAAPGLAAISERWRRWLSEWEEFRAHAEEYLELDDQRVLVFGHFSGRGRKSGIELGGTGWSKGASLFHIRDGRVTRLVLYPNRDSAIAELGL